MGSGPTIFGSNGNEQFTTVNPAITKLVDGKATKGLTITAGVDIAPTSGCTVKVDTDASIILAGDTVAIAVKLLGGIVYPYSIKRVVTGANIVGLY